MADDEGIDRDMYFVALGGVTRYALSEAVTAISRGALGHTFFPTHVEFRQQCDKAQRPVDDYRRRVRMTEAQMQERRDMDAVHAKKTPEARARVAAAHERFCAGYQGKTEQFVPMLDPELVARIPDNPTPFKKIGA